MKQSILFFLLAVLISACTDDNAVSQEQEPQPGITAEEIAGYDKILSSDAFQGRKPFTEGEKKTITFLVDQLNQMGLQPGNGNSYTQDVPLVEIDGTVSPEMHITGNGKDLTLHAGNEFAIVTEREQADVSVQNSNLVFCGFGIVAPEYNWNDYAGLDMNGKTAVVLVNDPGFGGDDENFFKGNTMTYYGRWTYKFEEAERQGAEGILIVHQTDAAGYPWSVVEGGWSGGKLRLRSENGNATKPAVQGWISSDAAKKLFATAGLDFDAESAKARTKGFKSVPLGMGMSVHLTNTFKKDISQNVVACIKGSKRPDETIIYTAHWDHFGVAEPVDGDSIYNGAVDNGIGVSCVLAIAHQFALQTVKPERTVVFMLVTAEEQGLLGSQWYSTHPIYPVDKTVANLNIDAIVPIGATKDLTIIGYGQSEMDDYAADAAKAQHRYVVPDQDPEKGFFFRSDHFNFARIGIPALYAEGGEDVRGQNKEYGKKLEDDYLSNRYHKPSDEFDPNWDLSGVVQDAELFLRVGRRLASEKTFPQWSETSEFRNIRKQGENE